jgi:nitrate/nitrite transporter NarK
MPNALQQLTRDGWLLWADRIGRKRMLLVGAALMTIAGLVFAFTRLVGAADCRHDRRHQSERT